MAFPAHKLTLEKFLSAQVQRTKTSSLSVKGIFLSTMSLSCDNPSDRRGTLPTRAEDGSQRLASVVPTHFLPQRGTKTMQRRKDRSSPPVIPTSSRCLEKRLLTKPASLESELQPATHSRKGRRKRCCGEGYTKVTAVIESGSEKEVRVENRTLPMAHENEACPVRSEVPRCRVCP